MKPPDNITLRDWFAGMALQALIETYRDNHAQRKSIVTLSFEYADQMMAERARRMAKEEPHPLAGTANDYQEGV